MNRLARRSLIAAALIAASAPTLAAAQDDEVSCAQRWSLARPMPRVCMDPIETDRPHLTETPHVVAAGHVQLESGLALVDLRGGTRTRGFFLENIYKVGLVSGVDFELLHTHLIADERGLSFARSEPLTLRAKIEIAEGQGPVPTLSLVPLTTFHLAYADGDAPPSDFEVEPGLLVFAAWELPKAFEIEVNVGATMRAQRPVQSVSAVLATALTMPIVEQLRGYVEIFAVGPHERRGPWDVLSGGGLVYLLRPDIQLDAGAWIGLAGDVPRAMPFVGASFRR